MAVIIKRSDGTVKKHEPTLAPDWYRPVPGLLEDFATKLETFEPHEMRAFEYAWVAYLLGFGSKEARTKLDTYLEVTDEWPNLIPWLAHPDVGDWLLPRDASWTIRLNPEGEYRGWAELRIGEQHWEAKAKFPFAAFAICLLRARAAGAFAPHNGSQFASELGARAEG